MEHKTKLKALQVIDISIAIFDALKGFSLDFLFNQRLYTVPNMMAAVIASIRVVIVQCEMKLKLKLLLSIKELRL